MSEQYDHVAYLYDGHPMVAQKNKWHACRYGLDATFVDPDTMQAVPAVKVARMLVDRCMPFAERLGCAEELLTVNEILDHGNGTHRQREVYQRTGDISLVQQALGHRSIASSTIYARSDVSRLEAAMRDASS